MYNEGQLRQFSKQLRMQKVQAVFNALAAEHRAEIMQMRRERNREGLQKLQDKLVAEAESKVGKSGLTDEQLRSILLSAVLPISMVNTPCLARSKKVLMWLK